ADKPRLADYLTALARLDITPLETPEPELAYIFRHIVTQEVAYESLLYAHRRELHHRVGKYLERTYADSLEEVYELLAHHHYQSGDQEKSWDYLVKAGDKARDKYANAAAIAYYDQALSLDADPEYEREGVYLVHESLGEVLTLVGQCDKALEHYGSARALVEAETPSTDSLHHLADLCHKTADVYERRSEYDVALEWLGKGLGYLDEDQPTIEAARIYLLYAGVYRVQGKYDEVVDWCQKSLAAASEIKTREGQRAVAHAYYNLGAIYIRRGDLQQAVQFCRESVAVYQQIDDIVGQSTAYNFLGVAYKMLGDWGQASDAYHGSLAISREIGDIKGQGLVTNNLGNIYLDRGEWAEAAALFEESNIIWKQLGAASFEAGALINLAQVHIYQENWSEARACLSRSQAILAEIGSEHFLPELERRWGRFYLKTDALDQALDHIRRSVELATAQGARLEEGMSRRVLGQVHLARDERGLAGTAWRQSLQILSDLDSEYEAAKTMLSLARLTLEDDPVEVQAQLEQVVQTFEKLGAQADLAEALALAEQLER
ncbi:MAG: tetratricopeptide repeat protein, partial [Dehalococcoidia bacterium]